MRLTVNGTRRTDLWAPNGANDAEDIHQLASLEPMCLISCDFPGDESASIQQTNCSRRYLLHVKFTRYGVLQDNYRQM